MPDDLVRTCRADRRAEHVTEPGLDRDVDEGQEQPGALKARIHARRGAISSLVEPSGETVTTFSGSPGRACSTMTPRYCCACGYRGTIMPCS